MNIRLLSSSHAEQFQVLRLAGLQECPSSFASSYAEEIGLSLAVVGERLQPRDDSAVLGAFDATGLVGVTGVYRESMAKLAHKANLWGIYVAPHARRSGIGRALVREALAYAERELRARQVNLGVNAANHAALGLYRQLGFEQFGLEPGFMLLDGVLQDEIHMVCRLSSARP